MTLRVPKAKLDTGLSETMTEQFGLVPEPLEATWHNPKVSQDSLEFGSKVGDWDAADDSLKSLAHMAYVMRNPRKLTRLDEPAVARQIDPPSSEPGDRTYGRLSSKVA